VLAHRQTSLLTAVIAISALALILLELAAAATGLSLIRDQFD